LNKLKVLSLFSGIGAFEKALTNLGIDYELVTFSEIDKYAIKSFCAIHNVDESLNVGDITKVDKSKLSDFDLLVGGSPCQAFSAAGKHKGFEDTRGTLFFDYVETLKYKQPKYFVFENVKGLINHDKGRTLEIIAQSFSEVGYRIDMELLNSKYFVVPQNRERIYIVGIREDLIEQQEWNIPKERRDVMVKGKRRLMKLGIKMFNFDWKLYSRKDKIKLNDIIEKNVDERYYLNEEKSDMILKNLREKDAVNDIIAVKGDLIDRENPRRQYGFDKENMFTLRCAQIHGVAIKHLGKYRIRKLIPIEYWRLQAFDDKDFEKVKALGISEVNLYKQASNSITVTVLEEIFKNLLHTYIK
jgi:DNA (cytosine-5)-methyltransferase 1